MMQRRHGLLWALGGGLAGCHPAPAPAPAAEPLRLAMDLWPGYYPGLLADELGWLREAGVQLSLSLPGNTDRMMADFTAGRHDLVAVALGDLISTTRGHSSVQVVLVTDESAGGDAVLARAGLGAPARAQRVATNLGGFGELFLREFARARQIDSRRWVWVNADAAEVPQLLRQGLIDLGHTWEPYVAQAEQAGSVRLFGSDETPGLIPDVLVATRSTLERRRPVLQAFVQAWLRAVDWWAAHPGEAARRVSQRVGVPADRISLRGVRLLGLADNRRLLGGTGTTPLLAGTVLRYSDFFLNRGTVGRPVDPLALLRPDLLP